MVQSVIKDLHIIDLVVRIDFFKNSLNGDEFCNYIIVKIRAHPYLK